jgi:hypothetical protein
MARGNLPALLNPAHGRKDIMRAEALEKLVDQPVKDSYGRYVGFVVGFSVDTSGELKSIGVDQGNGEFTEYPSGRIVSTADGFVLIPGWKVECDSLSKDIDGVKRRAKALQDLVREEQIPRTIYEDMMSKYSTEAQKIQGNYKSLSEGMAVRIGELEGQREALERFLVEIKVQFRAGEIDEAAYKVASESCESMQRRNSQEMEDLSRMLKATTEPISQSQQRQVAQAPIQQTVQATAE